MSGTRVRFAPSPTGPLHIGGLRTALYNYLFARKHKGTFILRIEDTDQSRFVPGAEEYILEALAWCGMQYDAGPGKTDAQGPYHQSERRKLYHKYAQQLVDAGNAYLAFDTAEELEAMREKYSVDGQAPKYDASLRKKMRNSLTLDSGQVSELIEEGTPYVIRLLVPEGDTISFKDRVRGEVSFDSGELDDKVLLKADKLPTYHLANVVDDKLMEISHVIRGEEWLSSTGHHVLLYKSFGWQDEMPEFAHLPLILKPGGKGKLSKRDGQKFGFPVFPIEWNGEEESLRGFREEGFEPEALVNFLAFLGWNPGDEREIFSMQELIEAFSLDRVVKSGARFDWDKALWFNQQHLHARSPGSLMPRVQSILDDNGIEADEDFLTDFIPLWQPRVTRLTDFWDMAGFMFHPVKDFDEKTIRKKWNEEMKEHFEALLDKLEYGIEWRTEIIKEAVSGYLKDNDLKFGQMLPLIRIAISGQSGGPDLFKLMELMEKVECLHRMQRAMGIFDAISGESPSR